jgi:hypothetical protein
MEICIVVLVYWFFFRFLWIFSAIEWSLLLFCFPSGGLAMLLLVFLWPFAVEAWVGFCCRIGIEGAKSRCCGVRHLLITTWTAFAWWCSFVSFCNSISFRWDFIFSLSGFWQLEFISLNQFFFYTILFAAKISCRNNWKLKLECCALCRMLLVLYQLLIECLFHVALVLLADELTRVFPDFYRSTVLGVWTNSFSWYLLLLKLVGGLRMYIGVTIKRYRAVIEVGKIKKWVSGSSHTTNWYKFAR